MYSFETVFEGIRYTVYLFAGFTGIIQPFVPEEPITAEEIYRTIDKYQEAIYTQGWYVESKNGPRLDILKKIYLIAEPFEIDDAYSKQAGSHYHCLVKENNRIKIGREITAMEAIHEIHYLRYVVNQKGELVSSLHIYNNAWDINRYKYNEQGRLIDRVVEIKNPPEKIPDF